VSPADDPLRALNILREAAGLQPLSDEHDDQGGEPVRVDFKPTEPRCRVPTRRPPAAATTSTAHSVPMDQLAALRFCSAAFTATEWSDGLASVGAEDRAMIEALLHREYDQ
jgi:hypothetical protein